jgi:hypothetical protein
MRAASALALTALLSSSGCGVPGVTIVGDDASEANDGMPVALDGGEAGPGDDASSDAPSDASCPLSPPSGFICCGDLPCGLQCSAASCSTCTSRCEAGQECCVRGSNVTCRPTGGSC